MPTSRPKPGSPNTSARARTGARPTADSSTQSEERPMRTLAGICTGALIAALAGPAAADGVADSKALIEKYSKLPSFEAPGPAFDAKACMKDKKIFAIPLTDDNPFEVAILRSEERRVGKECRS